ncbi:MAG: hypothetical protein ACI37Z_02590 [Candidatus Gastranaerophilaceae bacterium]
MTTAFIILSSLLFLSLLTGNIYFYNHKNRFIREKSVAIGAVLMIAYSIFCITGMFFASIPAKPILVFCGFSPFIIGHYTTYKALLYYTILQLMVISAGIVFAFGNGLV